MKKQTTLNKIFKTTFVCISFICICIVLLQSFKLISPPNGGCLPVNQNNLISDQAHARSMYGSFHAKYPVKDFPEDGGYVSKAVLCEMFTKMQDPNDTLIYYMFGRTIEDKNCIMLFNDPAFHDLNSTSKFLSCPPYCPPTCSNALTDYIHQ